MVTDTKRLERELRELRGRVEALQAQRSEHEHIGPDPCLHCMFRDIRTALAKFPRNALSDVEERHLHRKLRDLELRSLNFTDIAALSISSGLITPTQLLHRVDTEAVAATDNLAGIVGGAEGDLLILTGFTFARSVTVLHNDTGEASLGERILLPQQQDMVMEAESVTLMLVFEQNFWVVISAGPLSRFDKTVPPGANDDVDGGFSIGSLWLDVTNDKAYICLDNTNGAAVWKEITLSGSGSGSMTTVKEGGAQVGEADIVTLDFGAGFDVAETPDTEVNITLDVTEVDAGPVDIGTSNAVGGGVSFVNDAHVHNHPTGLGASLHHTKYLDADAISAVEGEATLDLAGDVTVVGAGKTLETSSLNFTDVTELTIATGLITPTQLLHSVDTEADAATDNLAGMVGGAEGDVVILTGTTAVRSVTIKHNDTVEASAGERFFLPGLQDIVLESGRVFMEFIFLSGGWHVVDPGSLVNLAATAAPDVNDDVDKGYSIGSRWIDVTADKEYVCLDNADGAAVWTETTNHAESHAARHADGGADELAVQDLASDAAADGQVAKADGAGAVAFEDDIKGLSFVIDGGGSTITTGIKGVLIVPFACEITAWNVVGDASGSINVDVNRSAWNTTPSYSSIAASAHPALVSAVAAEDTTLTGWTKTLAAQDILQFEVDSVATVKSVTVLLKVKRT